MYMAMRGANAYSAICLKPPSIRVFPSGTRPLGRTRPICAGICRLHQNPSLDKRLANGASPVCRSSSSRLMAWCARISIIGIQGRSFTRAFHSLAFWSGVSGHWLPPSELRLPSTSRVSRQLPHPTPHKKTHRCGVQWWVQFRLISSLNAELNRSRRVFDPGLLQHLPCGRKS